MTALSDAIAAHAKASNDAYTVHARICGLADWLLLTALREASRDLAAAHTAQRKENGS